MKSKQTSRLIYKGYDHKDILYKSKYLDYVYYPGGTSDYDQNDLPCFANQVMITHDKKKNANNGQQSTKYEIECYAWHKIYDDTWLEDSRYWVHGYDPTYDYKLSYCFPHYKCNWLESAPSDFVTSSMFNNSYYSNNNHMWVTFATGTNWLDPRTGVYAHWSDEYKIILKVSTDGMTFYQKTYDNVFDDNENNVRFDTTLFIAQNGIYFLVQYYKSNDTSYLHYVSRFKSLYYVSFDTETHTFGKEIKCIVPDLTLAMHEDLYHEWEWHSHWPEKNEDHNYCPGIMFTIGPNLFYVYKERIKIYEGNNTYNYYCHEYVCKFDNNGRYQTKSLGNYFKCGWINEDNVNYALLAIDNGKAFIYSNIYPAGNHYRIFSIDINGNYSILSEGLSKLYYDEWDTPIEDQNLIYQYRVDLACRGCDDDQISYYYSSSYLPRQASFIKDEETGYFYSYIVVRRYNAVFYKDQSNSNRLVVARTRDFSYFEFNNDLTYLDIDDDNKTGISMRILFDYSYLSESTDKLKISNFWNILLSNGFSSETVACILNYKNTEEYVTTNAITWYANHSLFPYRNVNVKNGKINNSHGLLFDVMNFSSKIRDITIYFDNKYLNSSNKDFAKVNIYTDDDNNYHVLSQTLLNQLNGLDYPGKET